ncbi:Neurofibromin [Colletotrichum sp. SAR 10_86]|nr:Neurofibromin [Colletotrichum sp. SAR 10_86]
MGIPAAFRWLSNKYPKIISPVIEEQPVKMDDGSEIPVDTTGPNPNGEELDNLYLDMNGIVHPCSHPEDRPAPKDEEEMMLEVFRYTDRVVNMVRPRKLLMIAVDGVAPRAKMNQQRSRRFRSAQDAQQKEEDKEELMKLLKQQNGGVIPEETLESMTKKAFDSNSITPGTPFMDILAASLRYWCAYKLNTDPAWARLKIIISDATVPGEGEHKIMSFVRSQRISPDYDPNTRHVIYGLDADLIMLGLATHEPHFRVLREDVFFQDSKPRVCRICGQKGHEARNCRGEAKEKVGEFDDQEKAPALKPFIWLHVSILREYLAVELNVPGLPFRFDLERALDDWVFMCCFVGNDFLPHLPALEIRENGIDTLTAIWKDNLPHMGGYVTKDGHVDLARAQLILNGLAKQEDGIFKRRKEQEDRREANAKRRKLQEERNQPRNARPKQVDNAAAGLPLFPAAGGPNGITHDMVVGRSSNMNANSANKSAASAIRDQIKGMMSKAEPIPEGDASQAAKVDAPSASTDAKSILGKRKADGEPDQLSTPTPAAGTSTPSAAEEAAMDHVRMWEEGYADRYYEQKFHVDRKDIEFRHQVARAYVEGLSWVLLYYFQGCPSWEWYYPYHYAPFAADFVELDKMEIAFEKGRISRPFEQLMSVLPAASRHALPEVFHDLMLNEDSEVIDFYPTDFEIDLNGKKMAWQGVALLPFIEMSRLLAAVEKKYPLLSAADRARNGVGRDVLLLSDAHHDLYDEITTNFYSKKQGEPTLKLNPRTSDGLSGKIEKIPDYLPHGELVYPLERGGMPNLDYDRSLSVWYSFPASSHPHKSMLLRGVKLPTAALDRNDIETLKSKSSRSGRSYGGAPLGHNGHNRGGRRDQFSYAPSGGNGRHSGNGNYMQHGYGPPGPPQGQSWQPPPPGHPGFGMGLPPPPPPAFHNSNGYSRGGGYGQYQSYGPPPIQGQYANHNDGGRRGGRGGYQEMNGDAGLVGCLVDRLATRLPHRTGTHGQELQQDDIVIITRSTLVKISTTAAASVLDSLVALLEDIIRNYKGLPPPTHPPHVLLSEIYILALAADCCTAHWDHVKSQQRQPAVDSGTRRNSPTQAPEPLDEALVTRIFELLKWLVEPIPEGFALPSSTILDDETRQTANPVFSPPSGIASPLLVGTYSSEDETLSTSHLEIMEPCIRVIVEYVTASTWSSSFDYFRNVVYTVRTAAVVQAAPGQSATAPDDDKAALSVLKILSFFWVDAQKLGLIIQEICSSFLHFRKTFQNTVAVVAPLLITRWLERYPHEFVQQHTLHKRLDGGADTLFDMTQTVVDNGRKKGMLYPLQTTLLFLLPDVFEVASNLRDAKSGSMAKKVGFLDGLRKALRNKNEQAAYSLVSLLRAARHFVAEDDAALVSYAMDVQDEVREAVFRRGSNDASLLDQDLMTAAFVSLAQLSPDSCVDSLQSYLSPSSPQAFKTAVVQGCRYFARQADSYRYEQIFAVAGPYMRAQLKAVADLPTETTATVLAMPRRDSNLHSSTNMACDVLKFLDASPHSLFNADGSGEPGAGAAEEDAFLSFLSCVVSELAELPDDVPEVEAASSRLETTLLVSLCSADIDTCQTVTSCIGIFYEENNLAGVSSDAAKVFATLLRNGEVYGEIASRAFRFTGLVAFQKRVRGLLRRLQYPTSGILSAWEYGFERWLLLSREVSMAALDAVDERTLTEWRNYSGFLASLGGICTANQAIIMEEPAISGLRWIDRLPSENHEEPLLGRYLKLSIQLLGCASVRIREATREVLSSEVSSTLYQSLFRALESELEVLFTGALAPSDKAQDVEIIFAEQAISLLKALVERLESPSDLGAASSIHLGALALNFAKFLDGVNDSTNTLRVKIKVCQLCEAVTKRKEHLNLRDDVRIRNQLLEYIFGWIARPRSPRLDSTASTGGRLDEMVRVQKDLDRASLRSLAELTFRLPLQPGEGQTDAGMSELKSQMFHTYFNRFLSLLNHESPESGRSDHPAGIASRDEGTPTSELAITILSNLLSANIDVGLKHSLNIGYHDNVEIRTAFVKVLYNILIQGTEFSNLTDAAVSEKYDELLELLTKDMTLVAAMSAVCPSSEVDELTISLLTIFEHRGLSFELLEVLIKQEIEETDNESEILRRTCVATKMLSVYAKWKGQPYLKATLQKVVERLMLTSKDLDLELDPARVSSTDELQKNALQLRIVAKVFIDDICASSTSMPASFRKICNIISTAVLPRFQEAKYTAVGAFVFLRFFCPAIVAPEVEGLVTTTPSKEMRRGLLLIAKVIQNLANNVLFGAKEPYMFPLNDFLTQNIYRVTTFLREISVAPETIDSPPSIESFDFGSCVALHRFLYDHWDHMRQRLVTQERKDYVRSPAEVSRGRSPVLEPLRHLITNLGPPPLAVTWNRPQISTNTPPSYSRFQNFMLRNAFRSTESFVTARAVYDGGESKDSLSIICIILRHIDAESIDYDTLLYCYLKIASRLWHKPFGLLIDATCYNGQNEPQDELFKKLELLTPVELSRNLVRIYVYNMNSAFRKCFRRLLRVSAKSDTSVFNPKNVDYHLIGSLQDLQAHFHLSQLHLPKETISVVTDTRYVFQPITRLSKTKGKIEVVIKVGSQFVQVTTTKKQEVFPGYRLSTTVNDIFRLGEVEEAPTSIQTEDDSAFGLRADNGKIVMYFTSPKKADVLQTIRGAKAKYGKDTRAHKAYERLIRPQDVPGTLLNLALTNLSSSDHVLRLSSYNLLGALCKAFKFSAASNLMCTKDVSVPMDPSHFIIKISRQLAMSEPQLTFDFLTEFFVGWETFAEEQKPLSLAYMSPWLPGLRTAVLANEADAEKGKEKVAVLFRKLIDVAMTDHSLTYTLEQVVWPAIYQDETVLDIFLEELMRSALSFSYSEEPMEALSSIVSGMGSITLPPPPFLRDGASMSTTQDSGPSLAATENLAALLFEVCSVAAPSVDISNAWRSRWMSLVASTAFQNNPAIQPRAFAVMGCLAREEVDDDLLYQVLVALRNSVGRLGDDTNSDMLISIVTSLSKMMAKLPSASRYGLQLFWLAISLLRYDDLSGMKDKDLLLNTAIELIDFQYLEDALQNRTLRWLTELASARPAVIMHLIKIANALF